MAVSNSWSSEIWNSSSRGNVSRMFSSDFQSWLYLGRPARSSTLATLRRSTGMSRGFRL